VTTGAGEPSPTAPCRNCGHDVPAGAYCGRCGATSTPRRGDGPAWLRLRAYAAAPDQHLLLPSLVTTPFPRLPRRSRAAFRVGLLALAALLVAFCLVKAPPMLVAFCALGMPLSFVGYLTATGAFGDLPGRSLALTAVLGLGAGTGWAFATNAIWAHTYDDVLATPMTAPQLLINMVAIPVGGVLLMLAPVALVRRWWSGGAESLDGFTIGALAALCFTAAGILTRGASNFASGLFEQDFPVSALLSLTAIRGVAAPLTAVAAGGVVGATLWFRPRADPPVTRHWYSPSAPALAMIIAVAAALAENAIDYAWISYAQIVALYAVVTVLALMALRLVLHWCLLGEARDGTPGGEPVRCPQCDHVVPDLAYCPDCGVAANAASRSSRRGDRSSPIRETSIVRLLLGMGTAWVVLAACVVAVVAYSTPPPAQFTCPPDCGRPPIGEPVLTNPRFTPADGSFSVSYPGPMTAYEASVEPDGVVVELRAGDGGTMHLFGEPAANRTPKQITEDVLERDFPNAQIDYEIPHAQVGYQPGYGVVADVYRTAVTGNSDRDRVLVMVAVKNGLALVAEGTGPFHEFSPEFGSGHPSGANFFLALDMAKYVNSFSWRGDPPR
jgi:hypothetical protein